MNNPHSALIRGLWGQIFYRHICKVPSSHKMREAKKTPIANSTGGHGETPFDA